MKTIKHLDPWLVQILRETETCLSRVFGARLGRVILYGSYARGDYEQDSDIDIIALVDLDQDELRVLDDAVTDIAIDLTTKYDVLVSLYVESTAVYNQHRFVLPFLKNVDKEGIVVYEH